MRPGQVAIILTLMPDISFTDQQYKAIRTAGQSVIVSAAAGSGKTTVLAERVAYLVCDAPPEERCRVDELLVLTFTEAAAAQMRARIVEAIRARLRARPGDDRLVEQVALVDAARISTIHSFCLWIVRRWFSHVGVDPGATVMDDDETTLLKSKVLDGLFSSLYATSKLSDEPLGRIDAGDEQTAFLKLVDDYGLGEDRDIARFVLKLSEFLASLPDPQAWLGDACDTLADRPEEIVLSTLETLKTELTWQVEHGVQTAATIEAGDPAGHFYASQIRAYVGQLRSWSAMLDNANEHTGVGCPRGLKGAPRLDDDPRRPIERTVEDALGRFEAVRREIAEYEFSKTRGPRPSKDVAATTAAARERAKEQLAHAKKALFAERLKKRFGLFSVEELITGLRRVAPYATTIVELVGAFREAYARRKRELGVLDFADLERLAFDLLRGDDDPRRASDVARTLHRRFAYVLVDEFQDINPVQEAIIELVSREYDPDQPDNLFVVGDVKQSIYRFRLAEPTVFTNRLSRFREPSADGLAIFLQSNFRSRPEILEAVNVLFRQLMREGCGDIVYDDQAELRPGRDAHPNGAHQPVELHLLERLWKDRSPDDEEALEHAVADLSNPARWAPIEREAFWIGSRVREWIESGKKKADGSPLAYRDITILLRATKTNAERMSAMLNAMDVSTYADVGGSLFGTREVRDVVAALELLDNFQQDIPLAGVLRSGIMGGPFSEDDLVEMRCLDRDIPFHAAVRQYVADGALPDLRDRLRGVLDRITRYRTEMRRRPLADVLWKLIRGQGYLAYAGGLPNGAGRRANLLKLHELARRFGSFRRQGLHRFVRFIKSLEEEKRDVSSAPAIGEADDVVRIMSIHQAKGLEFPVVFVAGLGTRFNLGDRSGRMIFERSSKIGLRVVDTERMIEYPTAAHRLAASEIERSTREEELRILYVAMTRAREKLILVGSERDVQRHRDLPAASTQPTFPKGEGGVPGCSPSLLSVATAATPLDWLIPALKGAPAGAVCFPGADTADRPLFDLQIHDLDEMAGWQAVQRTDDRDRAARSAVARCAALPADEPLAHDDPAVEEVLSRIEYVYPQLASTSVRASIAASEFQGAYDFTPDPEQRRERSREDDFSVPPSKYGTAQPDAAAQRGVITHRVLQHFNFASAVDAAGVASELKRMVENGLITGDERAMVNQASLEWFVSTPLAAAIRKAGDAYRREFLYIALEPLACFDRSVDASPDDQVLVRGIVDGILPVAEGIEIVDFKTDAIEPREVSARAERYRPQMEIYTRAMSQIWRRPVRTCWLVFLTAEALVGWNELGLGSPL